MSGGRQQAVPRGRGRLHGNMDLAVPCPWCAAIYDQPLLGPRDRRGHFDVDGCELMALSSSSALRALCDDDEAAELHGKPMRFRVLHYLPSETLSGGNAGLGMDPEHAVLGPVGACEKEKCDIMMRDLYSPLCYRPAVFWVFD